MRGTKTNVVFIVVLGLFIAMNAFAHGHCIKVFAAWLPAAKAEAECSDKRVNQHHHQIIECLEKNKDSGSEKTYEDCKKEALAADLKQGTHPHQGDEQGSHSNQ